MLRQDHRSVVAEWATGEAAGEEVIHYFVPFKPRRKAAIAVEDFKGRNGGFFPTQAYILSDSHNIKTTHRESEQHGLSHYSGTCVGVRYIK